jgi:hypothetical protein
MALGLSTGAVAKLFDGTPAFQTVFDSGKVEIYSGTRPTSADDVVGAGTLLASCPVDANSFAAVASGTIVGTVPWQETAAIAGGVAQWFRLAAAGDTGVSSTTEARIDGDVAASGSDLNLSTTTIAINDQVTITQFDLSA